MKKLSGLRIALALLIFLIIVLLYFALLAYFGWRQGNVERARQAQEDLVAEIDRQIELAEDDIEAGNYLLAERRILWLEDNDPNNSQLDDLRAQVEGGLNFEPSPTPTQTPIPTETPEPTLAPTDSPVEPTEIPESDPIAQFEALQRSLEEERWEDAINEIIAFQLEFPNYERFQTDTFLFDAYVNAGFDLTNGTKVALGVSYFEQAEKLGSLPEDAVSQLYFSKAFLNAKAYSGVNWAIAIGNFEEICTFAALFQNSCELLYEARLAYGTVLTDSGEHCPALEQYELAQDYRDSQEVRSEVFNLTTRCNRATATPRPVGRWTPTPTPRP